MIPVSYTTQLPTSKTNKGLRMGAASARFIGFMLLALFALLYIAQTSQGATKRVEVHQLQNQVDALNQDQDAIKLEADRLRSLDSLEQAVPQLNLQPIDSVEHFAGQ